MNNATTSSADFLAEIERKKKVLEVKKLINENRKLVIEQNKLKIEEADLQKPWFKKPQWWSVFIPLFIGFGTLWVAYSTGIFGIRQLQAEKAKLQKEKLQIQSSFVSERQKISRIKDTIFRKEKELILLRGKVKTVTDMLKENYDLQIHAINEIIEREKKLKHFEEADAWLELKEKLLFEKRRLDYPVVEYNKSI